MRINTMTKKFIETVREEKEGFKFDLPWQLDKSSTGVIIPILRKSQKKRDYIVFAEASDVKVEDTGEIGFVYVKNNESKPLLISRGDIFRGKTQTRAAIHDHIIMPGKGLRVCVRCVFASKGINSRSDMGYAGRSPYKVKFNDQQTTWNDVCVYTSSVRLWAGDNPLSQNTTLTLNSGTVDSEFRVASCSNSDIPNFSGVQSSDDLLGTIESLSSNLKEALQKIPFIKNQVGAAFFNTNTFMGLDVYDLPASWDAVKKDVVEKEGASFVDKNKEDMFQFKLEFGRAAIKKALSDDFEEKVIFSKDKEYTIYEVRGKEIIGEAIEFNGKIIHLTFWKK